VHCVLRELLWLAVDVEVDYLLAEDLNKFRLNFFVITRLHHAECNQSLNLAVELQTLGEFLDELNWLSLGVSVVHNLCKVAEELGLQTGTCKFLVEKCDLYTLRLVLGGL